MSRDEIEFLQMKQGELVPQIYTALGKGQTDLDRLNGEYDATVQKLIEILGEDAHCSQVDCELWNQFSDLYKDDNGCRPRGEYTRDQVLDYLIRTGRYV